MEWTQDEVSYLVANYHTMSADAIGKKLGRSRGAVYQQARKRGLSDPLCPKTQKYRTEKIQELHALGWSATEIGQELGISGRYVRERMHANGLKPNGRNERYRKRVAETTRQQCRKAGVSNLAAIRSQQTRDFAVQRGWPEHLALRSVQILELLYTHGPMTRKLIAANLGIPWKGTKNTLANPRVDGGSYLAQLQRAGLVVRLTRAIKGKGSGNHQDLYMVGLGIERCPREISPPSPASANPSTIMPTLPDCKAS